MFKLKVLTAISFSCYLIVYKTISVYLVRSSQLLCETGSDVIVYDVQLEILRFRKVK